MNFKQKLSRILVVAISALCIPDKATAEEIDVTLVAGHPPASRWIALLTETFIPQVDLAMEGTGHDLVWNTHFGGTLANLGGTLEVTEEGLADIALVLSVFEPKKLAIQNVSYYTPFSTVDTRAVLDTMIALHADDPAFAAQWQKNGLTYLGGDVGTADYVLMTREPVVTLKDLDGLKVGTAGPSAAWLGGTGAVAVSGNLTTYFTDLKSGVIDGTLVPVNTVPKAKLHEVAPHVLVVGLGAQYAGAMAANTVWFERQPKVVRDALRHAAAVYSDAFAEDLKADAANALTLMMAEGATVTDAPRAMRQTWVDGMDDIATVWASALEDGHGPAILGRYMKALRAAGQTPLRDWGRD